MTQGEIDDIAEIGDQKVARALIRSLTRGTAIPQGAKLIHVGHDEWLAAQAELLDEIAEDGYSDTKFVRGAYGAGKSHFLSVIQEAGRERSWLTSHIECHFDRVEIDKFETLYPAILKKLKGSDFSNIAANGGRQEIEDPVLFILKKWTERQYGAIRLKTDPHSRPFDAHTKLFDYLATRLLRGALPANFARALMTACLANLAGDMECESAICNWIGGSSSLVRIPAKYLERTQKPIALGPTREGRALELKPINAGTVHDAMKGLLWLIRDTGYSGLILCIDEIEELARLPSRKRQDRALQALREYVDHAGGDDSYKWLCMYLAATPEMFEGEEYFPRYDALASRIQPVSDHINWRAPVIDLDKTPLRPDQLQTMARRIRSLYGTAYGDECARLVGDDFLTNLVDEILRTNVRIARPRLLSRLIIDELDRARSAGSTYLSPTRIAATIAKTATALQQSE